MKIIVQKFGGTSVATEEARIAVKDKVQQAIRNGYSPVVVVSAMGRKGAPYATDTLIDVLKTANENVNVREMDVMMCCGEIISSCVMAATLQSYGINASALTGGQAGIITDNNFGSARIKTIKTSNMLNLLESGIIPVVCGFQGVTENNGRLTTLGRGGSDTTGVALGAALKAEFVEIYTDVDGIMTADPRIVEHTHIMDTVSYTEVCQMAHNGAKVIHPRAVEIAMRNNIPVYVKCTFSDCVGTLITNCTEVAGIGDTPIIDKVACGIAHETDIAQFRVQLDPEHAEAGQVLFEDLAASGISVGCLNLSERETKFCVYNKDLERTIALMEANKATYILHKDCAKVTVVGSAMDGVPGVMSKFVTALTSRGIQILQTVDSDTTIAAIVKADKIKEAVNALHSAFEL